MARRVLGGRRGAASAEVLPLDTQRHAPPRRGGRAMARVRRKDRATDDRRRKDHVVTLSDTGTARVNGYLFVLERSLKSFLPIDVARDAVREIESHLRERIASADGAPNERAALEKIVRELGPPPRVAQAYSAELTTDEAVTTGRLVPMLRAIWQGAWSTVSGFFSA